MFFSLNKQLNKTPLVINKHTIINRHQTKQLRIISNLLLKRSKLSQVMVIPKVATIIRRRREVTVLLFQLQIKHPTISSHQQRKISIGKEIPLIRTTIKIPISIKLIIKITRLIKRINSQRTNIKIIIRTIQKRLSKIKTLQIQRHCRAM